MAHQPPQTLDEAHALVAVLQQELAGQPPYMILRAAFDLYGPAAAISFSGAEDVALLGLARDEALQFRVFTLDTGRLHPQTLQFLDTVRQTLAPELEVQFPQAQAVQELVRRKGLFSFYQDGHQECCAVRKVEPLRRMLATVPAWITGQRKDQSPDTRAEVPVVQVDMAFSTTDRPLLKWNPLANWSSQLVWKYIRAAELPYNSLHDQGFVSIGCEPCTRALRPGEHERAARWWWEAATQKECGLHSVK
jgi:phosphoadenosine phosphosulfate reductase